jgi:hypothetical protein
MAPKLSSETRRRIDVLFKPEDRKEAIHLLVDECGNNLPFCENSDEHQIERLRFATLKLSNGNITNLRKAIVIAKSDWRDLLMMAGFGEDIHAHTTWVPRTSDS